MPSLRTTSAALLSLTTLATASPLQKRNIGGVRLCDQENWMGNCWYGVMPLNDCISLNSFAHKVLSFRPDEGTECFLMQGRCDSAMPYADLYSYTNGTGTLSTYDWIASAESFICFTPV